jgi:hypothetical protein
VGGVVMDAVAAGVSPTYQGIMTTETSAGGIFAVTNDARFSWLHVLAIGGTKP